MFSASIPEAMAIYGELVECYHGVNGYGSDTAEIYAYRLCRESPLSYNVNHSQMCHDARLNRARECGVNLLAIIDEFKCRYGCTVQIEGTNTVLLRDIPFGFDHRVHVRVLRCE